MKSPGTIGIGLMLFCWGAIPAAAQGCCHRHDYQQGGGDCHHGYFAPQPQRGPAPAPTAAGLQTVSGKIAEVVYLPGATAGGGMVELRVQTEDQTKLIRLAPSGFLKQRDLLLREGDAVVIKGFPVTAMEGDLIVATEVHAGGATLTLRDNLGRPAW